jgi:hypothetical protein
MSRRNIMQKGDIIKAGSVITLPDEHKTKLQITKDITILNQKYNSPYDDYVLLNNKNAATNPATLIDWYCRTKFITVD